MNIFGNALKYTQRGSIVVKLSLDPSDGTQDPASEERTLEIRVTDTGKGISSEYIRTRLFNRMFLSLNHCRVGLIFSSFLSGGRSS